ncbi:MAG: DUF5989 family protein [Bacteroidota bacterium]
MEFFKDYWGYVKERKKWFLIPVILILSLLGFIIAGGGGSSAVTQLIYAMF